MSDVRDALEALLVPALDVLDVNYYANGEDLQALPAVVCTPASDYQVVGDFGSATESPVVIRYDLEISVNRTIVPVGWQLIDDILEAIRAAIHGSTFQWLTVGDFGTRDVSELAALGCTLAIAVRTIER